MIELREIERLGHELANLEARYTPTELRKILRHAYAHRIKGGSPRGLVRLLREFASEIEAVSTLHRRELQEMSKAERYGSF